MAVCRCDPAALREEGPLAGTPHRPAIFRAVLLVNGKPAGSALLLQCRRCREVWKPL